MTIEAYILVAFVVTVVVLMVATFWKSVARPPTPKVVVNTPPPTPTVKPEPLWTVTTHRVVQTPAQVSAQKSAQKSGKKKRRGGSASTSSSSSMKKAVPDNVEFPDFATAAALSIATDSSPSYDTSSDSSSSDCGSSYSDSSSSSDCGSSSSDSGSCGGGDSGGCGGGD